MINVTIHQKLIALTQVISGFCMGEERRRFAELVRDLIERSGDRQIDFAARLDMSDSNLRHWIGTKADPSSRVDPLQIDSGRMAKLAQMLGWRTEDLETYIRTGDRPSVTRRTATLADQMLSAPIAEVLRAMEAGLSRLADHAGRPEAVGFYTLDKFKSKYKGNSMTVGTMIYAAYSHARQQFINESGLSADRIEELMSDASQATDSELEAIAHAINACGTTSTVWSGRTLKELISTTRKKHES